MCWVMRSRRLETGDRVRFGVVRLEDGIQAGNHEDVFELLRHVADLQPSVAARDRHVARREVGDSGRVDSGHILQVDDNRPCTPVQRKPDCAAEPGIALVARERSANIKDGDRSNKPRLNRDRTPKMAT